VVSSLFAMAILYGTSCIHGYHVVQAVFPPRDGRKGGWRQMWHVKRNQEHPGSLLWGGGNQFTQCSHSRWRYLQFQLAISEAVTRTLNSVVIKEGCSSKNMHESLGWSLLHSDMELGLRHCAAQLICYVHNKIYYWAVYHAVYMWRSTYTIVYYTTGRGRLQVSLVVFMCMCHFFDVEMIPSSCACRNKMKKKNTN